MVLPNVLSFPVVFSGALTAGAAVVPMNPLLKAREVEYYLRDSGARLVVALDSIAEAATEAAAAVGVDAVTVGPVDADATLGGTGSGAARCLRATGDRHDVSSLRLCFSGGSAMPVEVMRGFEEAFGCIILEGYGLSETSPVASFNHPHAERKPGTIGTPVRGVEMRLVDDEGRDVRPGDVGEIAIRGENVMKGYWS